MPNHPRRWVCPILCGCVIELDTITQGDDSIKSKIARIIGVKQKVIFDGPTAIINRCDEHDEKSYPTIESLYDELSHYHLTTWRPDTCKCVVSYYWDDREDEDSRNHIAVAHPIHTECCPEHSNMKDSYSHLEAVISHNRESAKNGETTTDSR